MEQPKKKAEPEPMQEDLTIEELEHLMVEHGIVLRAIPNTVREILEVRHKDEFPDGKVVYLEEFHRDMLIVERVPKHAGEFLMECRQGTSEMVQFRRIFYKSIGEAIADLPQRIQPWWKQK